ncbi:MAG: orotidine-5'-phosphate decarboxylase [Gemmataceae bacterium]|nr:orotidine-5'-phosphate decarboxylase [Gemmataceae bacterium]
MTRHFADRLAAACRAKGNALCVGLDPRWELLPREVRANHAEATLTAAAAAYVEFCLRVLDVVAPLVPVVKVQSAFFEALGPAGMMAQQTVLHRARALGLIAILDGKRNDIAATAAAYADAAFAGTELAGRRLPIWQADALTINPYLGGDAVEPFLTGARAVGGGTFVLVRTSNAGAGLFQDLVSEGKPLYEHVAAAVGAWSSANLGLCGFGDVGAVVGATHPSELAALRQRLPHVIFLVPGYGAQGGSAADAAAAFRSDGLGAIVNSSRGIIAAFGVDDPDWEAAVDSATRAAIADLRTNTPMGNLAAAP